MAEVIVNPGPMQPDAVDSLKSSIVKAIMDLQRKNKTNSFEYSSESSLISHIQKLQESSALLFKRTSELFGNRNTLNSFKNSLIGKFLFKEINQAINLNARKNRNPNNRNDLNTLLGGISTGLNPAQLHMLTKKFSKSGLGPILAMLPFLAQTGNNAGVLPSFTSGVSLPDTGFSPSGGVNSGTGNPSEPITSGPRQKYADLSQFRDRGSRNINPGNIKANTLNDYLGQVGKDDKGHAIFATKEAGVAGLVDRLLRYNADKKPGDTLSGKKTIADILNTFAPESDNNDTRAYIEWVSKQTGIGRNQQIDIRKNPEILRPIMDAIMRMESPGYRAYTDEIIKKGIEIGWDRENLGKETTRAKYAEFLTPKGETLPGNNTPETGFAGDLNQRLFQATDSSNLRYNLGSKGENGLIDCSGWIQMAMKKAGAPQNVIDLIDGKTAADQVIGTGRSTKTLREEAILKATGLKEGMLVGVKNNSSRGMKIGHVGVVVRNPNTGELGVSHSSKSKGVHWQPLAGFQRDFGSYGFVVSDPIAASRTLEAQKKKEEEITPPLKEPEKTNGSEVAEAAEREQGIPLSNKEPSIAEPISRQPENNPPIVEPEQPIQEPLQATNEEEDPGPFYRFLEQKKRMTPNEIRTLFDNEDDDSEVIQGLLTEWQEWEKGNSKQSSPIREPVKPEPKAEPQQPLSARYEPRNNPNRQITPPLETPTPRNHPNTNASHASNNNKNPDNNTKIPNITPESTNNNREARITPPPIVIPPQPRPLTGSLPSRVNSDAVLAYQLDPTTPVYKN